MNNIFRRSPVNSTMLFALLAGATGVHSAFAQEIHFDGSMHTYVPGDFTENDDLYIGNSDEGGLLIDGSNQAQAKNLYIGNAADGKGLLTLSGDGSSLTIINTGDSGNINIGGEGNGTLNVEDGAALSGYDFTVDGANSVNGSTGTLLVTGAGSTATSVGNMDIGLFGAGTVTMEDGGVLTVGKYLVLGYLSTINSNGTMMVTGEHSAATVARSAIIGEFGTGTMTVEDGGALIVGNALVLGLGQQGHSGVGMGMMTVSGANSTATVGGFMDIGEYGTGTLEVCNGASFTGNGSVTLGKQTGSNGTLIIGALPDSAATSAGTFSSAGSLNIGAGTGNLVFNHTDTDYRFNQNLNVATGGTLNVDVDNGTTTLTSTAWDGNTTFNGGELILGSSTSLGQNGNLTFSGGALNFGAENLTTYTENVLTLDGGAIEVDLHGLPPIVTSTTNLFDNADNYIRTLISADTLTGSAASLTLEDTNGNPLSSTTLALNDGNGNAIGMGSWGVKLATQGADLGLSVGLQGVDVNAGQSLLLNTADSGSASATFDAYITGAGGVTLNADNGVMTFGNAADTYAGATQLTGGTVVLATDKALGYTSALDMAATTILDMQGHAQTVGNLATDAGSNLNLDAGSLSVSNGGQVDGQLSGAGNLAFTGGTTAITGSNGALSAAVTIDAPATVTLSEADSLGSGNIALDGTLALQDVTGPLTNDLSGKGTLTVDPSDITLSGDNSAFIGTLNVADADSVLRAGCAANLGQAAISNAGTLVIDTADSWTLANTVTGSGNFTKDGSGTLTTGSSLQSTGVTTVDAGTLVLSQGSGTASSILVNSGATLSSSGDITVPLTLNGTLTAINAVDGYTTQDNGNLTLSGAVDNAGMIDLASASGQPGNTLTLTGTVTSNDGVIELSTYMGGDNSATDKVILDGATLSGTTGLIIQHAGGDGAQTQQGIEVVDAKDGSTTAANSFMLDSRSDGYRAGTNSLASGAYDYSLTQGGVGGDPNNWYLTSVGGGSHYRAETGNYLMNREVTEDMLAPALSASLRSSEDRGVWLQAGGDAIAHDDTGGLHVKARTRTLSVGADLLRADLAQGKIRAGVMVGTGSATTWSNAADDTSARGTVNGVSGGVYGRWTASEDAQLGTSVLGSLQYGSFSNTVDGGGLSSGESYRTTVTQASLRGEYGIRLYQSGENVLTMTPMLGLTGNHFSQPDFTEQSTGTAISGGSQNTLTTEAGMRWQGTVAVGKATLRPYLQTSWLHDSGGNGLKMDGEQIDSEAPDSRLAVSLGVDTVLNKRLSMSLSVSGETGAADYRAMGLMAGAKYTF